LTVRPLGVKADVVSDVLGLRCEVVPDPVCGTPMIVPRGRHHAEGLAPELAL
jgi:iron complex transport system ATP-binding protein